MNFPSRHDCVQVAMEVAANEKVDQNLVLAFCFVESSFNTMAHRFEPKWKYVLEDLIPVMAKDHDISESTERIDQMTSRGLMQVMGSVARELGYRGVLTDLYDPHYGVLYGVLKLKEFLAKYPDSQDDAIASYNAGYPHKTGAGYVNQGYVDAINNAMRDKPWLKIGG